MAPFIILPHGCMGALISDCHMSGVAGILDTILKGDLAVIAPIAPFRDHGRSTYVEIIRLHGSHRRLFLSQLRILVHVIHIGRGAGFRKGGGGGGQGDISARAWQETPTTSKGV